MVLTHPSRACRLVSRPESVGVRIVRFKGAAGGGPGPNGPNKLPRWALVQIAWRHEAISNSKKFGSGCAIRGLVRGLCLSPAVWKMHSQSRCLERLARARTNRIVSDEKIESKMEGLVAREKRRMHVDLASQMGSSASRAKPVYRLKSKSSKTLPHLSFLLSVWNQKEKNSWIL